MSLKGEISFWYKSLNKRDRFFFFILIFIIIAPLLYNYLPKSSTKQSNLNKNISLKKLDTQIENIKAKPVKKKPAFPNNYILASDKELSLCQNFNDKTPKQMECFVSTNHGYNILYQQGSYLNGGAFNQFFNDKLLAQYVTTNDSKLFMYNNNVYYSIPKYTSSQRQTLADYVNKKLVKLSSIPLQRVIYLRNIIKRLPVNCIALFTKNNLSLQDINLLTKFGIDKKNLPDFKKIYETLVVIYQTDSVLKKVRHDYLVLRMFEMGHILDNPEEYIELDDKQNIIYTNLNWTDFFATKASFKNLHRLVLDFYSVKSDPKTHLPILVIKERFDNNRDHLLDLFNNLSYNELLSQVFALKNNLFKNGTIEYNTKHNPTKLLASKELVDIYLNNYPKPAAAKNRAYERISELNYLFQIFESELSKKQLDKIDDKILWADIKNPHFKKIYDSTLIVLNQAGDFEPFNPYAAKYRLDKTELEKKRNEISDSARWNIEKHIP